MRERIVRDSRKSVPTNAGYTVMVGCVGSPVGDDVLGRSPRALHSGTFVAVPPGGMRVQ